MLRLIVTKKQLKRAVDRNRARRRVRAVLSQVEADWRQRFSGAIYLKPEVLTLSQPDLKAKIVFLLQKAKII